LGNFSLHDRHKRDSRRRPNEEGVDLQFGLAANVTFICNMKRYALNIKQEKFLVYFPWPTDRAIARTMETRTKREAERRNTANAQRKRTMQDPEGT